MDQGPDLIRDILILEARGATGQLEVVSAGVHTLLYFLDGQLVYAEGGSLTDTLGRTLKRAGRLTQEQYVAVLQGMTDALVEHEEMRFGEVAIGLGYLTPQDVTEGLTGQVRARLLRCLQYERSVRYFDEGSSYIGRVPRFPVELGSTLMEGLQTFYDEARLYPLLILSLERRWRLRTKSDWGATRFSFSGEELQAARQLIEPTRVADLIGDPPSSTRMRVALLLWLAGLVEDCEPQERPSDRPRSERPIIDRALIEDVQDRAFPSLRPPAPAPEPHTPQPEPDRPPRPPAARAPSVDKVPAARAPAASVASARARVLQGLKGVPGRSSRGGAGGAVAAVAALRGRRPGSSQTMVAQGSPGADPQVEAETYFQRGQVDLEQGRAAAARQHFEEAYRRNPTNEYGLYVAWAVFLTSGGGDVAEARAVVESRMLDCLRADRRLAFGHYVAGRLAFIDEELETAAKSFKIASTLDPSLTDAARSLRLVQQRLGSKKS